MSLMKYRTQNIRTAEFKNNKFDCWLPLAWQTEREKEMIVLSMFWQLTLFVHLDLTIYFFAKPTSLTLATREIRPTRPSR